jgi:hypothetical protein
MAIDIVEINQEKKDFENLTFKELNKIIKEEMEEAIENETDNYILIRVY